MKRKGISKFWRRILSSNDPASSKRLITLVLSAIFILAQIAILFIAFYVIFYTTKGKVDKDLLDMLGTVLEYDFYIILSGLGFITADNTVQLLVQRAQIKAGITQTTTPPPGGPPIEENPEEVR